MASRSALIREFLTRRTNSMLAFIVAVTVASVTTLATAATWVKFTHPELGFSLNYPGDWALTGASGLDFMAVGPDAAGIQGLRLNVNVTHESLPQGTSLDAYHAQSESAIRTMFSGYRSLQTGRVKIGNSPAMLRQYTWKLNNGVELYQLQLVTVDGTRGYVVTGTTGTASARLEDEVKLLGTILGTFRPR